MTLKQILHHMIGFEWGDFAFKCRFSDAHLVTEAVNQTMLSIFDQKCRQIGYETKLYITSEIAVDMMSYGFTESLGSRAIANQTLRITSSHFLCTPNYNYCKVNVFINAVREEVVVPNVSSFFNKEALKEDQEMLSDWHELACKFPFSSSFTTGFFHNLSPNLSLKASYFQRMGTKVFQHYSRCLQSGFMRVRKSLVNPQEEEDEITSFFLLNINLIWLSISLNWMIGIVMC